MATNGCGMPVALWGRATALLATGLYLPFLSLPLLYGRQRRLYTAPARKKEEEEEEWTPMYINNLVVLLRVIFLISSNKIPLTSFLLTL